MNAPLLLQNPAWLKIPGLRHGFSTRVGGVSTGPYASLNLKYPTGHEHESAAAVRENRRRLSAELGFDPAQLVACCQCHGAELQTVTTAEAGRGAFRHEDGLPDSDGMLTATTGLALLIQVADCLPILLVDPVQRVVGAVHAGWRGTEARILARAIARMQREFQSQPTDIQISIGPGIGFEHFEVGPEVAAAFSAQVDLNDPKIARVTGSKYRLNLSEINRRQALTAGIPAAAIHVFEHCTVSQPELFFSFRREAGVTGRLGGLIGWAEM